MEYREKFYIIQYGVRVIKYLGSSSFKYKKIDNISESEKFETKEIAEKHLNIFEKGKVIEIEASYIKK